jgi:saccharopine dehydrogenase-like NADP-dependent oxidoreductase
VPVLEKTIQYLEDLGLKVTELHDKGLSPAEIVKQIFGNEAPIAELTQQQFSSLNMVKSFLKTG